MKYTTEQTTKILNYIVKRAKADGIYSESIQHASINGKKHETVYEICYGTPEDSACVRLVSYTDQKEPVSLDWFISHYKDYKCYVTLSKWDITWEAETEDEVLDCLNSLVLIEKDMTLSQYLDYKKNAVKVEKKLTKVSLQDQFFQEN